MSKLSFRARALDANKSLPVYHEEDVPDLPDIASVNRVVPQMPTGMEKEEETEHHLQRAISAQQIYGEAQRLIIPTPDAILTEITDKLPKKPSVHMPKQLIHVQAFTLEDELPDYDCDEEDMKWLSSYNKKNSVQNITTLDFEKMMDILEKGCSSRLDLFTINDAIALIKKDEKLVKVVFDYWKEKRTKEHSNLTPTVRTEKKDGSTLHDPYVAFRRRIEKMQTRKNRKNDEASYEKMLKLRRDLNRACLILEMVKLREEKKRNLLQTTLKILETRYSNKDFNGELLHQCYDLLKQRQFQQDQPLATNNNTMKGMGSTDRVRESMDERIKREDEARKRHKLMKHRTQLMSASDAIDSHAPGASQAQLSTESVAPEGPDGKFTFRRRKGVVYHAPRYDSMGNWPWTHPVEGGSADSRYCYCCTSVQRHCRCIGFARRRVGRGGRILFDRAYTPYDRHLTHTTKKSSTTSSPSNGMTTTFQAQVPPWPHFKPQVDSSSDDEDGYIRPPKYINQWFRKDNSNSHNDSKLEVGRPVLCRSFSTQPTSKFRIHPYPSRNNSNQLQASLNNQVFLALLAKNVESQHWVLRRTKNHRLQSVSGVNITGQAVANTSLHMTISPSRPASTAPSSAIYQLNFPLPSSTTATCKNTPPITINNNNNNIQRKPNNAVVSNGVLTNQNAAVAAASLDHNVRSQTMLITTQPIVSRQPLSIVHQQPFISQKVIPQNTVQMSALQVQPVTSVRGSKLSISKGLAITHAPVVSNGITTPAVPGVQLAR